MSIQWIRDNYSVPAKVRGRIEYTGADRTYYGTITGTRGPYLLIRLDHQVQSGAYHPTWHIRYLGPDEQHFRTPKSWAPKKPPVRPTAPQRKEKIDGTKLV